MKQNLFFILLGLIFLFTACKSKKVVMSGPIPVYDDNEIISALEDRNVNWDWLISKAGINIDSPAEKVGGTMYLRMKKDSVIWVMVKKFGVEAARAQITPDSFQIAYRLDRSYDEGRIEDLMHHYKLDLEFEDMQQMMFGNVMLPDSVHTKVKQSQQEHLISGVSGDLKLTYALDPYQLLLERILINDRHDRDVRIEYLDYREVEDYGKVPYERRYVLPYSETETASLKLEFKDFEINKPRAIKFSIPSHYEKL